MEFYQIIETWYAIHRRDLPWRGVSDPYKIWISEIILQQTRVVQGYDYYLRFLRAFPTVEILAAATEDEVLRLWQGLGYYSRARNLHCAARSIVEQGGFPTTYAGVRALKGVGDYTAAAICSFAYNLPCAVIDGNVYRVLSRYFGVEVPIDTTQGKQYFAELAQELLDKDCPGEYNQALMDFGAMQCTPQQPNCGLCPLHDSCQALAHQRVDAFPVKSKKTAVRDRFFVYLYLHCGDKILLHRRRKGDIWQGLYEPLLFEFDHSPTEEELLRQLPAGMTVRLVVKGIKHVLSHQRLWVDCYEATSDAPPPFSEEPVWVSEAERDHYAVPRLVSILYDKIDRQKTEFWTE